MIITCDKCKTRFQFDIRLIKKTLFKVRCSKCKHVFSVDTQPKEEVYELRNPHIDTEKKIIAVCNHKGGVAKTSTVLNLGASLSLTGKKILLIDFDVQANLSLLLGHKNAASFYEIIQKETDILAAIKNIQPNLYLLPSNTKMALLAKRCLQQKYFGYVLSNALEPIKDSFDTILIDTPPSIKFFTPNALIAADFVIIPTQSEFLSMNGVLQTENIIQALSKLHPLNYKILMTLFDEKDTATKVIYSKLKKKYADKIFNTVISLDPKMRESQIINKPVISYDSQAISALQYQALAKEIELM